MNIVFYHMNDSTFILITKVIRAKLFPNHSKISKMHNINIQVFTSVGTPGVQPVRFFLLFKIILASKDISLKILTFYFKYTFSPI